MIAAALGDRISFTEIGRARARERMISQRGSRTADALLDVTGGDIDEELLTVRDTVTEVTGCERRTPGPLHPHPMKRPGSGTQAQVQPPST